jgi:hypothetical protein
MVLQRALFDLQQLRCVLCSPPERHSQASTSRSPCRSSRCRCSHPEVQLTDRMRCNRSCCKADVRGPTGRAAREAPGGNDAKSTRPRLRIKDERLHRLPAVSCPIDGGVLPQPNVDLPTYRLPPTVSETTPYFYLASYM